MLAEPDKEQRLEAGLGASRVTGPPADNTLVYKIVRGFSSHLRMFLLYMTFELEWFHTLIGENLLAEYTLRSLDFLLLSNVKPNVM